jgi:hypothetical protein
VSPGTVDDLKSAAEMAEAVGATRSFTAADLKDVAEDPFPTASREEEEEDEFCVEAGAEQGLQDEAKRAPQVAVISVSVAPGKEAPKVKLFSSGMPPPFALE